jgi:ABC-2 type transport system permease protein
MNTGFLVFEIRRIVRARKFWILAFVFPTLMYLMQVGLFRDALATTTPIRVDAYLMSNLAAFGALFVALNVGTRVAAERSNGWQRQLRLTPLSPVTYLTAKVLSAMIIALAAIVAVTLVGALVEGVRLSPGGWAQQVLGIWAGTLPFALLGILIGQISTVDSVQVLITSSHMLLGLLGGVLFPASAFPDWMAQTAHILPSYWLSEIGHGATGGDARTGTAVVVLAAWTVVLGGAVIIRYLRDSARV